MARGRRHDAATAVDARASAGGRERPAPRPGVDLGRYWAVVVRFRRLLLLGTALALFLAVVAYTQLGGKPRYHSTATVFVTQPGFPAGRSVEQYVPGDQRSGRPSVPVSDSDRLANLTALYAQLAMSAPVQRLITASDRSGGKVFVSAVAAPPYATPAVLPLLRFSATAPSGGRARALADNATTAFRSWLQGQQSSARIPDDRRVVADRVSGASKPSLVSSRSPSLAVIVFLAFLSATFGLAIALENLRPRPAAGAVPTYQGEDDGIPAGEGPRTANGGRGTALTGPAPLADPAP